MDVGRKQCGRQIKICLFVFIRNHKFLVNYLFLMISLLVNSYNMLHSYVLLIDKNHDAG